MPEEEEETAGRFGSDWEDMAVDGAVDEAEDGCPPEPVLVTLVLPDAAGLNPPALAPGAGAELGCPCSDARGVCPESEGWCAR